MKVHYFIATANPQITTIWGYCPAPRAGTCLSEFFAVKRLHLDRKMMCNFRGDNEEIVIDKQIFVCEIAFL